MEDPESKFSVIWRSLLALVLFPVVIFVLAVVTGILKLYERFKS